jgi:hypothetical protein
VTPLGLILVPLTLAALLLRPRALLWLTVVAAVFQGGAVLNYVTGGGTVIPVMPFYFVCAVLVAAVVLRAGEAGTAWGELAPAVKTNLLWLGAFAIWAVASAFVLPRYFQGLLVNPPRVGMDISYLHLLPLHFGHSNLAQAVYLPLVLTFLLFTVTLRPAGVPVRLLYSGLVAATGVALAVGFYQKAASAFGWPYPAHLVISNLVTYRGVAYKETVNGLGLRLSSTFSEASYAGAFMAAGFIFFLTLAAGSRRHRAARFLAGLLCLTALALTGASTGYASALAGLALFALAQLLAPLFRGRVRPAAVALTGLLVLAFGLAFVAVGPSRVTGLINTELLHKATSGSALRRFRADRVAWGVIRHTWGLGAGLGSDRPSSLILYLLSNVGVLGTLLFAIAVIQLLLMIRRRLRSEPDVERRALLRATLYAFLTNLGALVIAVPDLSWQLTWVLWALLLAQLAAPARRPVPHPQRQGYAPLPADWQAAVH